MYSSAGQISLFLSFIIVAQAAPANPLPASLTVRAAPSASTPVAHLPDPKIFPFDAVSSYFLPLPAAPVAETSGSSPSSSKVPAPSLASETTSSTFSTTSAPSSISFVSSPTTFESPLPSAEASSASSQEPGSSGSLNATITGEAPASSPSGNAQLVVRGMLDSRSELVADNLFKRATNKTYASNRKAILAARSCVGSNANETTINSLLYYGGPGAVVKLCPRAVININNPIFFFAAGQVLTTAGEPTGKGRATIVVHGAKQACAIYGAVPGANNAILRNIQVNGNRPNLGIIYGGIALLEFGGNTVGQKIQNVRAFEPRGWSALHSAEGGTGQHACSGMEITGNQVGPAGNSPTGPLQFRRRDTVTYTPGQWADGISHACPNSMVANNVITDATDGAIVVFGAPGSTVSGNTIIAESRVALGGINAVDWMPFGGSYVGTVVKENHLIAQNSMIKVGIAIGGMIWGVDNRTASRTYGGSFLDNDFSSGPTGYFGYGIGVSGHKDAIVTGNKIKGEAAFGGVDSAACFTGWFPLPKVQPFIADPTNTPGSTFQDDFWLKTVIVLAICKGPGAILSRITG